MKSPDFAQLANKEPLEKVAFWFDYWNSVYPIPGLRMEFQDKGYIEICSAFADSTNKITAFHKDNFSKFSYFHGQSTARHEHVHQILAYYGYPTEHKLLFALVDNALVYAFENQRSTQRLEHALKIDHQYPDAKIGSYFTATNSISHYDFHEDDAITRGINTRLFFVLAKRLSRHSGDIEKLLATADKYADYLNETAPKKKAVRSLQQHIDYLNSENNDILEKWGRAEKKSKQAVEALNGKLDHARESNRYLNGLNMRWQGAFVLMTVIAVSLLLKVMA